MQTVVVEQDKFDPEKVTIAESEKTSSGHAGHSIRIEKSLVPKLIVDLINLCGISIKDYK